MLMLTNVRSYLIENSFSFTRSGSSKVLQVVECQDTQHWTASSNKCNASHPKITVTAVHVVAEANNEEYQHCCIGLPRVWMLPSQSKELLST